MNGRSQKDLFGLQSRTRGRQGIVIKAAPEGELDGFLNTTLPEVNSKMDFLGSKEGGRETQMSNLPREGSAEKSVGSK